MGCMKRVRNCNGCKAYYQNHLHFKCELGYKLKTCSSKIFEGTQVVSHKPENGICPKPKTYDELFNSPTAWQIEQNEKK